MGTRKIGKGQHSFPNSLWIKGIKEKDLNMRKHILEVSE